VDAERDCPLTRDLLAARAGDAEAARNVFNRMAPILGQRLQSQFGSRSAFIDDAVQEALASAMNPDETQFEPIGSTRGWMITLAINWLTGLWRRAQPIERAERRAAKHEAQRQEPSLAPGAEEDRMTLNCIIASALPSLSPREFEFLMQRSSGSTADEIAKSVGVTATHVRQTLRRARAKIAEHLQAEHHDIFEEHAFILRRWLEAGP